MAISTMSLASWAGPSLLKVKCRPKAFSPVLNAAIRRPSKCRWMPASFSMTARVVANGLSRCLATVACFALTARCDARQSKKADPVAANQPTVFNLYQFRPSGLLRRCGCRRVGLGGRSDDDGAGGGGGEAVRVGGDIVDGVCCGGGRSVNQFRLIHNEMTTETTVTADKTAAATQATNNSDRRRTACGISWRPYAASADRP